MDGDFGELGPPGDAVPLSADSQRKPIEQCPCDGPPGPPVLALELPVKQVAIAATVTNRIAVFTVISAAFVLAGECIEYRRQGSGQLGGGGP